MTLDDETVDQEIIDVLRGEASAPVPPELRARIAGRLAIGVGITGLATSVAGATQAAAASGAVAVGARAAGTLTLLGLSKSLLVGLGLGAGAGLGLHVAFRLSAPTARLPSMSVAAPVAPNAVAPTALPSTLAPAPSPSERQQNGTPTVPATTSRVARAALALPEASMNPTPELPRVAVPEAAKSLAEQQALLDDARAALRRGDGQGALAAVREHVARFPRTSFDEEREAVAIRALLLVGRRSEASERQMAFEERFPASLLARSLHAALGASVATDSVTEPAAKSQTQGRE